MSCLLCAWVWPARGSAWYPGAPPASTQVDPDPAPVMRISGMLQASGEGAMDTFISSFPVTLRVAAPFLYVGTDLVKQALGGRSSEVDSNGAVGLGRRFRIGGAPGVDFVACLKRIPLIEFMLIPYAFTSADRLTNCDKNQQCRCTHGYPFNATWK